MAEEYEKTVRDSSSLGIEAGWLGLRCFIEGVEVPIMSVSVRAHIMKSAMATVEIPAAPEVMDFKPRSLIHIFYWDSSKAERQGRRMTPTASPTSESRGNPYKWHLLFAGEAAGFKYLRDGTSMKIQLTVVDFTSYWSSAKLYFGKSESSTKFKQAMFMGAVRGYAGKLIRASGTSHGG